MLTSSSKAGLIFGPAPSQIKINFKSKKTGLKVTDADLCDFFKENYDLEIQCPHVPTVRAARPTRARAFRR